MSGRALMFVGGLGGACLSLVSAVFFDTQLGLAAFAAGALFGKGYGIWEERRRSLTEEET